MRFLCANFGGHQSQPTTSHLASTLIPSTLILPSKDMLFQSIKWHDLVICCNMNDTTQTTCHQHLKIYVLAKPCRRHSLTAVLHYWWHSLLWARGKHASCTEKVPSSIPGKYTNTKTLFLRLCQATANCIMYILSHLESRALGGSRITDTPLTLTGPTYN